MFISKSCKEYAERYDEISEREPDPVLLPLTLNEIDEEARSLPDGEAIITALKEKYPDAAADIEDARDMLLEFSTHHCITAEEEAKLSAELLEIINGEDRYIEFDEKMTALSTGFYRHIICIAVRYVCSYARLADMLKNTLLYVQIGISEHLQNPAEGRVSERIIECANDSIYEYAESRVPSSCYACKVISISGALPRIVTLLTEELGHLPSLTEVSEAIMCHEETVSAAVKMAKEKVGFEVWKTLRHL